MKIDIKDLKECQKLLKIQVEPQRVLDEYQNVLKEFSKSASVPGFRQGKAPVDMIKTHYSQRIKDQTLHRLIEDTYHDAVSTNKIEVIGYPKVDQIEFEVENKPLLNFSVTVDIRPEIKLKVYKGIKVKPKPLSVEEDEIHKTLGILQGQNAQFKTIDTRPARMGDYIVCDYKITSSDGRTIDSKQNVWLYLNEDLQMPELAKNLVGSAKDTTKQIEVVLPQNYPKKEYKNVKTVWQVNIKQIKEKILPAIDNDLAKDLGNFKNLEELKNKIKEQLANEKAKMIKLDTKQQIFDFLLKNTDFSVPPSLLQTQTQRLVNEAKINLLYQGLNKEQIDSQQATLEEKLKPDAQRQLKVFFILEKIGDEEKIVVTEQDKQNHIEDMARSSNQTREDIIKYIDDNDLMADLEMQLRHEKTVEFLLKNAIVEEGS